MKATRTERISVKNIKAMDKLKAHPKESYDDIITGLLLVEKRTRKVNLDVPSP